MKVFINTDAHIGVNSMNILKSEYDGHVARHTGHEPYMCVECEKSFHMFQLWNNMKKHVVLMQYCLHATIVGTNSRHIDIDIVNNTNNSSIHTQVSNFSVVNVGTNVTQSFLAKPHEIQAFNI